MIPITVSIRHSLLRIEFVAHAVLDVVVDDEVQLLLREAVVLRQKLVDVVDDGLAKLWIMSKLAATEGRVPDTSPWGV
jgi:hypothetical protein